VDIRQFADENVRRSWIVDKHMKALSLHDGEMPPTVIDLLAESPMRSKIFTGVRSSYRSTI